MIFIPQEIKEKMNQLEDENKRLEVENNRLERELKTSVGKKASNGGIWVLVVLLAAALVFIIYQQFVQIPKIKAAVQTPVEDLDAVMVRDGLVEKWNRQDDGTLVYRVQLGAYADFDLEKYKQNIEGLYQDSIDGYHKVSLGAFTRLVDAQQFQQEMVRMGLNNVYIVAYENKQPIGLIEAKKKEQTAE